MYPHYDLCVWSQTKWPYIQAKLQDLGVVGLGGEAIPDINILFILDKNAMFKIRSNRMVDGRPYHHEVQSTFLGTGNVDDFI
jgi:ubiquitin-like domain-containing CTD phosphatase 1